MMTPEEAYDLMHGKYQEPLDGVKDLVPGQEEGWQVQYQDYYWNELPDAPLEDANLYRRAHEMVETIAAMTYEYAVQIDYPTGARLYVRP